jgi:hypothetical protein
MLERKRKGMKGRTAMERKEKIITTKIDEV